MLALLNHTMALIRGLAKQNHWRILGTFIDEFNFRSPQQMYLLDRTYNWECPFRDSCANFLYSEPCLFKGDGIVCLRCCTDKFRIIWYGDTGTSAKCVTGKRSGDTKHADAECEDFPQIDLYQRAAIHSAGRKSSLE